MEGLGVGRLNANGEAGEEGKNTEARQAVRRRVSSIREETDPPTFIPAWSRPYGRLPTARSSPFFLENFVISASPLLDFDDGEIISAKMKSSHCGHVTFKCCDPW